MASNNYQASLTLLLAHEGGYSNNPKDPGGPTNKGITQAVYDAYRHDKGLASRSVKLIEDAEVAAIYTARYWAKINGDELPAGLDYAVFDYAVNSGPSKAVKDIQRTINDNIKIFDVATRLNVDGDLGPATMHAIEKAAQNNAETLIENYCAKRLAFMRSLKNWGTFGTGWTRRVEGAHDGAQDDAQDDDDGVVDLAVKMASAPVVVENAANPTLTPDVPVGGVVVTAPAAIGARAGETPAKALGSQVSILKTVQGVGAALAAAGVTGNTVLDAAGTAKDHVNGTLLGQIALVVFVSLMFTGVGLVLYKFFEDRREKGTK